MLHGQRKVEAAAARHQLRGEAFPEDIVAPVQLIHQRPDFELEGLPLLGEPVPMVGEEEGEAERIDVAHAFVVAGAGLEGDVLGQGAKEEVDRGQPVPCKMPAQPSVAKVQHDVHWDADDDFVRAHHVLAFDLDGRGFQGLARFPGRVQAHEEKHGRHGKVHGEPQHGHGSEDDELQPHGHQTSEGAEHPEVMRVLHCEAVGQPVAPQHGSVLPHALQQWAHPGVVLHPGPVIQQGLGERDLFRG
mmetsp:Transcript_22185/g.62339  ORF Transcript_22185/g.62339 Transcript_22185/m.62339 type:complete len:245 (-) Transcript_22185:1132-1866(-)